jgi:hypothetical protein
MPAKLRTPVTNTLTYNWYKIDSVAVGGYTVETRFRRGIPLWVLIRIDDSYTKLGGMVNMIDVLTPYVKEYGGMWNMEEFRRPTQLCVRYTREASHGS